jgi:alkaline phosphatase
MKARILALLVLAALVVAGCATSPATEAQKPLTGGSKNVIFLLTDGTGPEGWPLARWVKGAPLAVDEILAGAVRTCGADSIITDSAPGAAAYATGH